MTEVSGLVAIVIVVAVLLWPIRFIMLKLGWIKPKEPREFGSGAATGVRRFVMQIADTFSFLLLLSLTTIGGVIGYRIGWVMDLAQRGTDYAVTGAVGGALIGFVLASLWLAMLFTLTAIEHNTRHMASVFEQLVNRSRPQ